MLDQKEEAKRQVKHALLSDKQGRARPHAFDIFEAGAWVGPTDILSTVGQGHPKTGKPKSH